MVAQHGFADFDRQEEVKDRPSRLLPASLFCFFLSYCFLSELFKICPVA